jgi:hypothetical protein
VELSKQNIDLNPEYSHSLEGACFSVHLAFDSVEESSLSKAEHREFADSSQLRGKEAFEAGLVEVCPPKNLTRLIHFPQISKFHSVVPNASMLQQLSEMKFPSEYLPVALQLSNNDLSLVSIHPLTHFPPPSLLAQ